MTLSIMMMMVMILLGCWKTTLQQMRLFAVVIIVLVKKAVEELSRFSRSPLGPLRVLWVLVGSSQLINDHRGENPTATTTHPQLMLIFN